MIKKMYSNPQELVKQRKDSIWWLEIDVSEFKF